jgi:hypothetical protein
MYFLETYKKCKRKDLVIKNLKFSEKIEITFPKI